MLQKFISIFFKVKYKQNQKITRFLCFKWKEEIKNPPKFVPFVPDIPHVGKCTYTGPDIYIPNSKETKIGKFCSIGLGVSIGCGRHPLNFLTSSPFVYADYMDYKDKDMVSHNEYIDTVEPVNIGNDVWIGDRALIMNGVTIGDGAVIGAHAVVTKDVPPYAIVVGVPARIIKYRFSEDIIARLLKSEWWNLPDNIIKKIPYDNISETLDFLEHLKK